MNVFWATSSVLVQRIADDMDYDQPVVITYIGACLLSCFIPIHVILVLLGWTRNPSLLDQGKVFFLSTSRSIKHEDIVEYIKFLSILLV